MQIVIKKNKETDKGNRKSKIEKPHMIHHCLAMLILNNFSLNSNADSLF